MINAWKCKKLGDICSLQNGRAFKKSDWSENGLPIIRIANLNSENALFNHYNGVYDKKILIEKDDLLFSWSGTIGSSFGPHLWKKENALLNQHIFKVNLSENLSKKFVYYLLLNITSELEKQTRGAVGLVHVNKSTLVDFEVEIPPLQEQKQIVETLDKAFEKIDKAIANIEKNIQNAEELFQSQIESRFNSDLSWERINLGDLSKIMYGHTSKVDPNGNCKYLRITDIQDSKVNWDQVPSIKIDEKDFFKYNLNKGDIVFARTGATTGKSYLIKDNPNAVFASYLIRVQINNNNILPEFVYKFFSSREYWRVVKSGISGSAQGGFNASKLSELEIKFPKDIIVQNKVVQEIDIIEKNINTLLSKYHTKLLSLSNLKKSILEKAFKGELTSAA